MNIPIMLALITLVTFGISTCFSKVAGANQVYSPSYMIVSSVATGLVGVIVHLVQSHSFELSAKMFGLASLSGITVGIAFCAMLLALRLGGQEGELSRLVD